MECSSDQYKRNCRKFSPRLTVANCQSTESTIYLKCALYRSDCKVTANLEKATNLFYHKSDHNHTYKIMILKYMQINQVQENASILST